MGIECSQSLYTTLSNAFGCLISQTLIISSHPSSLTQGSQARDWCSPVILSSPTIYVCGPERKESVIEYDHTYIIIMVSVMPMAVKQKKGPLFHFGTISS